MTQMTIDQAVNLATSHHSAGRLAEAEAIYRQILGAHPNHSDALHLLGVLAHQCGNNPAAIELIRRSIAIKPINPVAHGNLGEVLRVVGQKDEAIAALQRAIQQHPQNPEAMGNLALTYADLGRFNDAIPMYQRAIALNPQNARNHTNLGTALASVGKLGDAVASHQRALQVDPNFADAHNNLGSALEHLDRLDDAMAAYRRCTELDLKSPIAFNNLGNIMRRLCQWDEAMHWCLRALEVDPNYAPARWNVGLLELTKGDYPNGWPKYELRFTATSQRLPPGLDGARWDGSPLNGRAILLYGEQGIGDGWQAARYVTMVVARGAGRIIIECHAPQVGVMKQLAGVAEVIVSGDPRPAYDVFAPMMSLPMLFGTTFENIPAHLAYLHADADKARNWREKLSVHADLKVGLVWGGSMSPDPTRTCKLSELAPLGQVPGVCFFSLQVGSAAAELKDVPAGFDVIDLMDGVTDFSETAARMVNLDLIITIDTSTAHFAAALGCPTWTLIPFSPDWRWFTIREDSPWYPTMRLFRQTKRKEWSDVIERVVEALRTRVDIAMP